jgi:predicted SnoaL-like aldol condensation-catalyzing enzyme
MKNLLKALVMAACLILSLSACNNAKNTTALSTGNDSLLKRISILEDTLRFQKFNKRLVADFYQQLFGDKDISSIDRYVADDYIQHNPGLKDGKEALKEGAAQWFKGAPKEKIDIQHISAEGNLVYIHTKANRGTKVVSVLDIFKVEGGKILEHWDIIQDVPEKSANSHPMF